MTTQNIHILLADDDQVDCLLFKEALDELPVSALLTVVHDGEQLIERITEKANQFPDVLFLDLNMPRKNGFVSLGEIKRNFILQNLPVVVFSTASDAETVKRVFRDAAHYFIRKPADFSQLKKVIYEALILLIEQGNTLPLKEKFVLTGESIIIPAKQ